MNIMVNSETFHNGEITWTLSQNNNQRSIKRKPTHWEETVPVIQAFFLNRVCGGVYPTAEPELVIPPTNV